MGFTISRANTILSDQFVKTITSGLCIGLSTTAPNEDGSNFTEPSADSGYLRTPIRAAIQKVADKDKQVENTSILFFALSKGAGYGTVTHFGLFEYETSDTPFFTGALNAPIEIPAGYVPIFDVGALKIGLDKEALE